MKARDETNEGPAGERRGPVTALRYQCNAFPFLPCFFFLPKLHTWSLPEGFKSVAGLFLLLSATPCKASHRGASVDAW